MSTSNAGAGTAQGQSSSVSAMLSTLVPVAIQAGAFVAIFLLLRAKFKRVYQPRTYINTLREDEKSTALPDGKFSWMGHFKSFEDEYVLNHQSLDGYLYLRFLKLITILAFAGAVITWPILFPVNATGGGGQSELDILSFSNIADTQKNRYYAHALLAWVYFGFVLYMVTRETLFFINLRHAYMLSPFVASKLSSRTVLFTDVPAEYQNKERLQTLFGTSIRRSWLATDCKELTKLVEERDKASLKLENAEIKLSQTAVKAKIKADKKAAKGKGSTTQSTGPARKTEADQNTNQYQNAEGLQNNGSHRTAESGQNGMANRNMESGQNIDTEAAVPDSQWLRKKDRPTHRLGKIPLIGKKVDTIEWGRSELKKLIPEVIESQESHAHFKGTLLPAIFVEFTTQQAAQAAFRRMSRRRGPKMNPTAIETTPEEVIWKNLKIGMKQRKIRKILAQTFITLMIMFWAIPVAVVGAISNINYLIGIVPFLSFINSVPSVILGVITGLLPSVMLAILMALVPIICRLVAKLSGLYTTPAVELKTQGWYMAFQVIQVFLVTTFASGAAATVQAIIDDPSSATTLLASSLPKASNFFISYFILQGLGIAAGNLLNLGALAMLTVVGKFLDKSPRKMFNRYITLSGLGWGSLYPKVGNLAVIAITYSIIAPLVLGFATIGFALIYLATRYNTFFVLTNNIDTKGLSYAKALQQILTGVYLGEVCLLGLFAISTSIGPIVLTGVLIAFTAIYHALMRQALYPLTRYLPENYDGPQGNGNGNGPKMLFNQTDQNSYDANHANGVAPTSEDPAPPKKPGMGAKFATMLTPITSRLFNPMTAPSHAKVRSFLPNDQYTHNYTEEELEQAYYNPSVTSEVPRLWYVRDDLGISGREVTDTSREVGNGIHVSDEWATFDAKGKVVWEEGGRENLEGMPIWEGRVDY